MTNLKKLRAFSFYFIFIIFFNACSSKPVTEMYTITEQAKNQDNEASPFIIINDQSLTNQASRHYLKIAKEKNPEYKSFIILTSPLNDEHLKVIENSSAHIDGFILHYPVEIDYLSPFQKPIINTSILDLRDDQEFFADKNTLRFFRYDLNEKTYVLSSPAPIQHFNQHEDPYRFYFEDVITSTLRLRKELKKTPIYQTIIVSNDDVSKNIKDETHPYLFFSNYTLNHSNFFLVGTHKVQFCHWFYKATNDCFEATDEENELLGARKKILKENNEKIEASFYNEKIEILTTN